MLLDVYVDSLYLCPSLDIHKINKQRCDLARNNYRIAHNYRNAYLGKN